MHIRRNANWALAMVVASSFSCHHARKMRNKIAIDHYVRGQLLADQGDVDAALAELAKAVRVNKGLSVAYSAMGDIHRKRNDYPQARESYESACQTNPYAFKPHYNLGVVYQSLAAAATRVEQVRDYFRQATGVYLRAMAISPKDFDTHLNLSACYYSLGKYDLAQKYCEAAIALKPNSPEAYSNLGIIYDGQGQVYQAIKAYRDSLELDVHQPKLLMNLGATYSRQGQLGLAILAFKMAAKEDPDCPEAWERLGTCHYHAKQYDKALTAYTTAIRRDPRNPNAHRGLGVVYMTQYVLNGKKAELREKALAAWHASLELNPNQKDIARLVRKYAVRPTEPSL